MIFLFLSKLWSLGIVIFLMCSFRIPEMNEIIEHHCKNFYCIKRNIK